MAATASCKGTLMESRGLNTSAVPTACTWPLHTSLTASSLQEQTCSSATLKTTESLPPTIQSISGTQKKQLLKLPALQLPTRTPLKLNTGLMCPSSALSCSHLCKDRAWCATQTQHSRQPLWLTFPHFPVWWPKIQVEKRAKGLHAAAGITPKQLPARGHRHEAIMLWPGGTVRAASSLPSSTASAIRHIHYVTNPQQTACASSWNYRAPPMACWEPSHHKQCSTSSNSRTNLLHKPYPIAASPFVLPFHKYFIKKLAMRNHHSVVKSAFNENWNNLPYSLPHQLKEMSENNQSWLCPCNYPL